MSHPHAIFPGVTYLLTRRALRRHMLFRPDAAITRLIMYALTVSAQRHGMHVHAFCAMSTHLHIVATDTRGLLPKFLHSFHRLVALGTKVIRAWEGSVWDNEATSAVKLLTRQAVLDKIAYTIANPVAAGLVQRASDWPGAKVFVEDLGRGVLRTPRPDVYFNPLNRAWPEAAELALTLPPDVEEDEAEGFRREIGAAVEREETMMREALARRGVQVLGAERAAAVSPEDRSIGVEEPRGQNPTFAVGRGNRDVWQRAAATVRGFRATYRKALEQWCAGVRNVEFPAGTWWMRVLHAVAVCAVAPAWQAPLRHDVE